MSNTSVTQNSECSSPSRCAEEGDSSSAEDQIISEAPLTFDVLASIAVMHRTGYSPSSSNLSQPQPQDIRPGFDPLQSSPLSPQTSTTSPPSRRQTGDYSNAAPLRASMLSTSATSQPRTQPPYSPSVGSPSRRTQRQQSSMSTTKTVALSKSEFRDGLFESNGSPCVGRKSGCFDPSSPQHPDYFEGTYVESGRQRTLNTVEKLQRLEKALASNSWDEKAANEFLQMLQ